MKLIVLRKSIFVVFILFIFILFSFSSYFSYKYLINKDLILENTEEPIPYNENIDFDSLSINEEDKFKERENLILEKYKEKKLIALTFDDGPSKYTETLIDELKKRNIVATFFVLGQSVEKYPETVKFAYDTGNEIGIHGYSHKLFTKLTEEEIVEEITKTTDIVSKYIDIPITFIRVPYGSRNEKVDSVLEKYNLTDILWSVDSKDWKLKNSKKVYNYVLKYIKGNDIILMHDTFQTSINAAIEIVDFLTDKGYLFVTISELEIAKQSVK